MPSAANVPHKEIAKFRKLLDQVPDGLHLRNYSYETEKICINWARRYILF